jgi:hypothetical protein
VSDWLLEHTKEELQKLIADAPVWTPQASATQPSMTPETAAIATAQLLDAIKSWILTYVVISEEQAAILAVWVLHTYVLDASDITPYIHITAPEKESGKSLLMDVLAAVACNPIRSGGMTAAALVRMVDKFHPTVFLDEMDAAIGGDKEFAEAQRGILNEGFKRGGRFFKCDGKDHELRAFEVFSCKCFAGIGKLPDTVTSRSIVIEMRRKLTTESVAPFRQRVVKIEAAPLRSSLDAWASKGPAALLQKIEPTPIPDLGDRQNDICEPLLAIAKLAGKTYLQRLVGALLVVFGASGAEDASIGVALLRDIRAVFEEHLDDKIPSVSLALALGSIEGSPGQSGTEASHSARIRSPGCSNGLPFSQSQSGLSAAPRRDTAAATSRTPGRGIVLSPQLRPQHRHSPRLHWLKPHIQTATHSPLLRLWKVPQTRVNRALWRLLRFKTGRAPIRKCDYECRPGTDPDSRSEWRSAPGRWGIPGDRAGGCRRAGNRRATPA